MNGDTSMQVHIEFDADVDNISTWNREGQRTLEAIVREENAATFNSASLAAVPHTIEGVVPEGGVPRSPVDDLIKELLIGATGNALGNIIGMLIVRLLSEMHRRVITIRSGNDVLRFTQQDMQQKNGTSPKDILQSIQNRVSAWIATYVKNGSKITIRPD